MNDETIVAVFDTPGHAEAAISDLEAAGIPSSAITRQGGTMTAGATSPKREPGFWQSMFGGEHEQDTSVYDRSLDSGSTVVSVRVGADHADTVMQIFEKHSPIDIDDRAAGYGVSGGSVAAATTAADYGTTGSVVEGSDRAGRAGEEVIALSEEVISVGKRLLNRGTTRIRRYMVETPVEENVSLHSERVTIERRPATGAVPAGAASFTDHVVEVTESEEEAVIGKTAHVREEVVVRREGADRVETVHDTVRREDVEITKDGTVETDAGAPLRRAG